MTRRPLGGRPSPDKRSPPTIQLADVPFLWRLIAGAVLIVPLLVSPSGKDVFRVPKYLAVQGEAVLVTAAVTLECLLLHVRFRDRVHCRGVSGLLPLLIVAWTTVTTIFSTNRALSVRSLVWVLSCVVIFSVTARIAPSSISMVHLLVAPALINAALYCCQEFRIWDPLYGLDVTAHEARTALIGNPNEVGAYLVAPLVCSLALMIVDRSRRRLHTLTTIFLFLALLINHTVTAIAAFGCGAMVLLFRQSKRLTAGVGIALGLSGAAMIFGYGPLHERADTVLGAVIARDWDTLTSYRLTSFLAAQKMALSHPLVGVGPGTYGWNYLRYREAAESDFPRQLASPSRIFNFGEAHNDHLQILATTGVIGYCLFMAAIIALAMLSFRPRPEGATTANDMPAQFSRTVALPLAVAFAILTLFQFPLELAGPTMAFLYAAAVCVAWSDRVSE